MVDSVNTGKDIALYVGVVVTLVLGVANLIYNFRNSRRTAFVNVVTAERIKWIQKVRENVALLCTLCEQWVRHPNQTSAGGLHERMERIRSEVRLQLNPNDQEDCDLERLLMRLPSWTNALTPEEFDALRALIVDATKGMLKREWDKVKDEAQKGDLRTRAERRRNVG